MFCKKVFIGFLSIWLVTACSQKNKTTSSNQLSDHQLLDTVQHQTFQYFWDGSEKNSGAARERINLDQPFYETDIVATGATGFGLMGIVVGIEKKFVAKEDGVDRLLKILNFLKTAERFHGAWPHWIYGETGKVKPFSKLDDGGDLVETAFVAQGLVCIKQYFKNGNLKEKRLANLADELWKGIDFKWYTKNENVLYWHWSPKNEWKMNLPVHGFNECLIMYVMAAASPNYGINKAVYDEGWAMRGKIKSPRNYNNIPLQFFHQGNAPHGGPLFWSHYSFLGLNPNGLKDEYGDYGLETKNMVLINYQWCVDNPLKYKGYGKNSWGLTSSYSVKGYAGHAPEITKDLGVIAPTAAISSIAYTPIESLSAIRYWYTQKKDKIWGKYGFYDAFSDQAEWYKPRYLGIDQGPELVMIENYRTGLLWKLFMSDEDVQKGLKKLNFTSPNLK
ncbi:beta-glucosidase [Pedobacter psychrophilus]|uniref:Beta-glucosidase n=1 Tax=Pedobacter psychrophilus TaxID=1826909 RepID=A0A179DDQ5_9SPHI|nr:glucoamylase family protein [Pedobacter psychrophilus]OAQ39098.1 beta-glucosidase [Pedobacter psychrophilus]